VQIAGLLIDGEDEDVVRILIGDDRLAPLRIKAEIPRSAPLHGIILRPTLNEYPINSE